MTYVIESFEGLEKIYEPISDFWLSEHSNEENLKILTEVQNKEQEGKKEIYFALLNYFLINFFFK